MRTKSKYLLVVLLALVYSCNTEEDLFPNCEFPYPTATLTSESNNISREEIPEEIVQYALHNYENITSIDGVVIDNCIRDEILLVNLRILEVEFIESMNGQINEIHRSKDELLIYNSCGSLIGTGTFDSNSSSNNGNNEFISSIENIIDEDIIRIDDIFEFDFDDDSLEYFVQATIESNTEDVYYFLNLEEMTFCVWE